MVGGLANTKTVLRRTRNAGTDEFGLTSKERRFCDHLLTDPEHNRRKAYIQAGYSVKSMQAVDRGTHKVYRRPQVQRYLALRRRAMSKKVELKQEDVLEEDEEDEDGVLEDSENDEPRRDRGKEAENIKLILRAEELLLRQ